MAIDPVYLFQFGETAWPDEVGEDRASMPPFTPAATPDVSASSLNSGQISPPNSTPLQTDPVQGNGPARADSSFIPAQADDRSIVEGRSPSEGSDSSYQPHSTKNAAHCWKYRQSHLNQTSINKIREYNRRYKTTKKERTKQAREHYRLHKGKTRTHSQDNRVEIVARKHAYYQQHKDGTAAPLFEDSSQ